MVDYSDRPLLKKLGYQAGEMVYLEAAPADFKKLLHDNEVAVTDLPADWAHGFFTWRADAEKWLAKLDLSKINKGLWVSWPKKSAGVKTDMTEHTFRELILPTGWVDVKVCAIDDTWSAFKFVRRKN